ncbi:MAG: exonuclease SbcCD subunit D [Thiomicrospira sp.]|jgi:exonuclease SbcD|nr:exonuclease SbcCD subunit D [Thiomicrospira sp.]
MKLLHTADWHLGKVLHNQSLLAEQADVLSQIIDYAQLHQVEAVLVAGDIYDRSMPPTEAVRLLNEIVNRFSALNITLIMISGNHDSAPRLGFAAQQLQQAGLHILSDLSEVTQPVVLTNGELSLQVFGIPFADPEQVRDVFGEPVKDYDHAHTFLVERVRQARNPRLPCVLMSHCFVDGAQTCESEKTLSVGGSDRVSYEPMMAFDYVALGHLHSPQAKGAPHIRYAGSPLKYSFSEHWHQKSVTLLTFDATGLLNQQMLPLTSKRDVRVIEGRLDEVVAQGKLDPNHDDYLMVRLHDTCALLDPMGRLREVYPNVLHLEKTWLQQGPLDEVERAHIKLDPAKLMADFYQQIQGEPLSEAQLQRLQAVLDGLNREAQA